MNRIKNWVLKHLLNAIRLTDVIGYEKGIWSINGKKISEPEMEAIREEAKYIDKTRIWALLQGTLAEQARDNLFNKAKTVDDMLFSKAVLHCLDIQDKVISKLIK